MGNVITLSVRSGIVTSINAKEVTVKVKFPDLETPDGKPLISGDLQVRSERTFGDREYWMPDIDEQVTCFFFGTGIEHGFVGGGLYSTDDPPPVTDANKHHRVYKDESFWEYDRKEHKYTVKISGKDLQDNQQGDATARDGGGGERGGSVDIFIEKTTDIYGKGKITIKCDDEIYVTAKKDITVKSEASIFAEAEKDIKAKAGGNIELDAGKDCTIKAGGNFKIEATGNVDITGGGNMKLDATFIDIA